MDVNKGLIVSSFVPLLEKETHFKYSHKSTNLCYPHSQSIWISSIYAIVFREPKPMSYIINRKSVLESIVIIQLLKANLVHNRSNTIVSPPYSVILLVPYNLIIIVQVCTAWDVVWNTIGINEASDSHFHIGIELFVISCTWGNSCYFKIEPYLICIEIFTLVPYSDQILKYLRKE